MAGAGGPRYGDICDNHEEKPRDRRSRRGRHGPRRVLAGQVLAQQQATAKGNSACAATVPTTPSGAPKGTSMHGWGKATDFAGPGGFLDFGSSTYRYLEAAAGQFRWNHPGWARPGGSA